MMKKAIFYSFIPAVLAAQGVSQTPAEPPAPPPPPPPPHVFMYSAATTVPAMPLEGMRRDGKPVTNAPYQADIESQTVQRLADGNVIQNSHTSKIARDSQGRTRTEETLTRIGPWAAGSAPRTIIFISDPVSGNSYVLHPDTKTVEKMSLRHFPGGPGKHDVMVFRKGGEAGPRNAAVTATITDADGPTVSVQRLESPGAGDEQKEDLGTQEINGVTAQGKRITRTIPANTVGNQMPIVSVSETWYSPELKTVVESKHTDPRFGDTTFSLKNIQKGEPAADLFQVPGDYTVTDGPKMAFPLKP
jgi:hypothetical protein